MSVLLQTAVNTGKLYFYRKTFNTSVSTCKCLFMRKFSDVPKRFSTFDEVIVQRRAEARRSLVVQVNSESSFKELYGYCSKYASINGIHHYKNSGGEHFMLIEFSTEENLKDVLLSCSAHQKDYDVMSLQSPFVWFRALPGKKEKQTVSKLNLAVKEGTMAVNEEALLEELLTCNTVSDQIQLLYDRTILNDLGVRLRFMVARQLEAIFESLYANIQVRPFGSSVNGFGRIGCDLDLVLTNILTDDMSDPNKRLVYQEKKCEGGRSPWQRHMELIAELLELRVPGAARVQRILQARVPIVKYAHDMTGVDCDLCYSNMSGVYMSELLWLFGSLDPRVRPLTFVVRHWAQTVGLTNPHPGRWITNFPLILMVLFFLQQNTKDGFVLPTLKYLLNKAGKEDIRISEDSINCTFLRDLNKLPKNSYGINTSSLEVLLLQFFEFYSQFDFNDKAISINEGVAIRKPNNLPLYIVNPLEPTLNVSRNVSYEECEKLRMEVRNAAWQLESSAENQKGDDWGVLSLIEQKSTRGLRKLLRVGNSHRLVSVKDLFNYKEDEIEDSFSNKIQTLAQKVASGMEKRVEVKETKKAEAGVKDMNINMLKESRKDQKMKFKTTQMRNEVYRIRRNKVV